MNNSQNNISDFELLLRKQTDKKPSFLYNKDLKPSELSYKPQDVIKTVCSQVKAYQLADSGKGGKSASTVRKDVKKSSFIPVNKLPIYGTTMEKVPKPYQHKFETQCELDTQVMNIMDAAVAIDGNTGFTQEFDTTFSHNDNENGEKPKFEEETHCYDVNSKIEQDVISKEEINIDSNNSTVKCMEVDHCETESIVSAIELNSESNPQTSKTAIDDTVTFNDNLDVTQDENEEIGINNSKEDIDKTSCQIEQMECDIAEDVRSPSPVLNIKSRKIKSISPPRLVVSLKTFENFENMAMSLIEDCDFETAKHLINSQILGNELCINSDAEVLLGCKRDDSPILEFKSNELQVNSNELILTNQVSERNMEEVTEKRNEVLKDEILFSSDEEQIWNDIDILPPTCILDISDDEVANLNDTMYVGFQTASNKSIQISRDSYDHAQRLLDNDKTVKELSLTELVEKCDKVKTKRDTAIEMSTKETDHCETKPVKSIPVIKNDYKQKIEQHKNTKKPSENPKTLIPGNNINLAFIGFTTASNKNIQMSDAALKRCQKVFQDIDLNQNFDDELPEKAEAAFKSKPLSNKLKHNTEMNNDSESCTHDTIDDKMIIEEFENIEMSLEEKENNNTNKEQSNKQFEHVETIDNIDQPSTSKAVFIGFKTANNKEIKISDEALEKSKDVFKDIGSDKHKKKTLDDILTQSSASIRFIGFKTANNKDIKVSDEAMSKTKNIFKDIDKAENKNYILAETTKSVYREIKSPSSKKVKTSDEPLVSKNILNNIEEDSALLHCDNKESFIGFRTASNKQIKTSDQAIEKSRHIFKDITINDDHTKIIPEKDEKAVTENKFVCFRFANDKAVTISANALEMSKKIFSDLDPIKLDDKNQDYTVASKENNSVFKGFQTASNKPVTVSADALAKSKKIFNDIDKGNNVTHEHEQNMKNPVVKFMGFHIANEKPIEVDKDALIASKKIFEDINEDMKPVNAFVGFKTASNKKVVISDEALKKCRNIFDGIDDIDINASRPSKLENKEVFTGFQTASNKKVGVSEEALQKTKKFFDDIKFIEKDHEKPFLGFQTANNKKVEDSQEALKKTKNLFDDTNFTEKDHEEPILEFQTANNKQVEVSKETLKISKNVFDDVNFTEKDNDKPFRGFQTANNKEVTISEDALKKSKNLLSDVNFIEIDHGKPFLGFQTANNNEVKISKEALVKSRQLFQNLDIDNDNNIPKKDFTRSCRKDNEVNKKHTFTFQTGTNKEVAISEDALIQSQKLLNNNFDKYPTRETKLEFPKYIKSKDDTLIIENIIDTQVINDFDVDVCSEDFRDRTKRSKRSGSPILVCPKAKKRKKFEAPYNTKSKTIIDKPKTTEITKPIKTIECTDNYKKDKKYTLKELADLEKGENKNIDPYTLNFNLEDMLKFEFEDDRNDFQNGKMNVDDVKKVFMEGIDKKLVPDGWLDIQIKLILWKLISYEVRFPNTLGKVCTVKNLIDQLKYRFDKELYNAERSVLRKILEKDDVSSKPMVLCVAGIYVDGASVTSVTNINNIELQLTDGWYFIKATIDNMLSKLVYDGRIIIGSKILTCGAELVNCEQGVAPWEDVSSIRLVISGNSTRPARWHTRLGLRPSSAAAPLAAVRAGGGKIAALRAGITRVYPALYVEKLLDGSTVTRSERLENQYQMKYETEREAMIEKIYEEVEKEMSDQESQDSGESQNKRRCYDSGSQIAKMMKNSKDPMEFRAQLTSSQVHLLQSHVSLQRDRNMQAIQDKVRDRLQVRNVVTLVRGRIVGFKDGIITRGMLSIWKPNDEVLDIFKEGSWIEVTNVVPTAFRNSEIQLSAGRQSVFKPVKCKDNLNLHLKSLARTCYQLKDLSQNPSMIIEYNEIDTVGIIFAIEPTNREFESNKNQFQNLYLADIDKHIISVNFWGGIKKFGYENILDTGQVIYCGNLQKRAGNSRKNIPQFRATEFAIFTKTPKNEKGREMVEVINKKMLGLDRRKFCEDCVAVKQNYSAIRCLNDCENISPYRFNNSDYNLGKNRLFIETPVGIKVNNKVEEFNLTGLDFESTFRQQETQLSPKTLERKKKINEKIAKLKRYGEPPPLSPIHIINKSKNATNSYKSPLARVESGMSNVCVASVNKLQSVATPTKLPDNEGNNERDKSENSPIISMNRTYVKKNINPVKLSFTNNVVDTSETEIVDHFAEEFEASPPLSLE